MKTTPVQKAVRLLFVIVLMSLLLASAPQASAQEQNPTGDIPEPQAADSQNMLPPAEPRVKTNRPAPFLGIKASGADLSGAGDALALDSLPNLFPYDINSYWSAPVVLSPMIDATETGGLTAGAPFYLNMAVANGGLADIAEGDTFTVSVTINGVVVYTNNWAWGLPANYYLYEINYWIDAEIPAGTWKVELTADVYDGITESNESDNLWSGWVTWAGSTQANLAPYTPDGWTNPVQITSTPGIEGDPRLYSDQNTYFHFAYVNEGFAAANGFYVNILLDNEFLYYYQADLDPNYYGYYINYLATTAITPGWHTVKLWLDDTDAVDEYNEDDNVWEADFYWEASNGANLHPYQASGWDDALVVSSTPGTSVFTQLTAG